MFWEIALVQGRYRYAAGVPIVQALLLAGCGAGADGTVANNAVAPVEAAAAPAVTAAPQGPERLILAFGDSLYAGYGLDPGQSLADVLQARLRKLGINAKVVNAGVSGDTTAAGRQRLAFSLDNLPRAPDAVVLGLGGNDVLRQLPPAETRANLTAMLDELRRRKLPVVLTGMQAPPNLGPDFASAFNPIWPDLAKRYDAGLYPFILDGVITDPALMQADHVHPNAKGVRLIADRLAPVVAAELPTVTLPAE